MWPGIILAILGSAIQNREQQAAYDRQRAETRTGRKRQRELGSERRGGIMEQLEQYDPNVRQAAMDAAATETEGRLASLLTEAASAETPGGVGDISETVLTQRAQGTLDQANRASSLAELLSKVRAPGAAANEELIARKKLESRVRGSDAERRRAARMTELLTQLEGQTDADTMLVGGLAQGLGMSMASGDILSALNPTTAGTNLLSVPTAPTAYPSANPDAYASFLSGAR